MLEVLYHRAKFGGARISPAAGVAKNVEFFCLSVWVWLGHLTRKTRPDMIYIVFSGTLKPTQSVSLSVCSSRF